ncbi:GNAT family N-acetyltransferase [Rhizobium cremeum]|uniref:GNAT family N-acetyltransferase n=1 Tax=Rhizobium cremeum TaxID=2813827 RepID=UPI001FD5E642|nr:GNAT family N-acetyltransferase [Rhizobium cremeum]MCJ7995539.1 GNAT family N-acetyltransferase [Rhizobium cremeum]MCJ8001037.1 GNAT family N-acetyltransferase [Rhizobium cremeum]
MEPSASESLLVDTFQARMVDIHDASLEQLHALSIAVGWPHRADDWQFLREMGQGFVALDEIDRILGSAMWFSHGDSFATVGMVISSPRLQTNGTGNWLMQRVLAECKERGLRLNATRAARRLYQSLNFAPEKTVYQCQGEATRPATPVPLPGGATISTLGPEHLNRAIELDARAFGVERRVLMEKLFEQSVGYGLFREGRLEAFALCRHFGRGHVVGPVVAGDDEDAIAVVQPHVLDHEGAFLRLDTHRDGGAFATFLSHAGLPVFDTVLTMSLSHGKAVPPVATSEGPKTYGLVSQALG